MKRFTIPSCKCYVSFTQSAESCRWTPSRPNNFSLIASACHYKVYNQMRAARAASGMSKKLAFVTSSRHADLQRPPSPYHKTTRSSLASREATLLATPTKARRVPRGSATKRSRAGARVTLQNDASSRFSMPYPGFGADRPSRVSSPFSRMRHYHHSVPRSPERAGARHTQFRKVFDSDGMGAASVRRCHETRRSASEELSRRVVAGRPSAPPQTSFDRTMMREYSLPAKAFDTPRSALAIQGRRERSRSPTREEILLRYQGSNRITKRPASAPARRGKEFSQSGEVLKELSRMADGPHSPPEELRIMKWVLLRETYITKLRRVVPASDRKRFTSSSRSGRAKISPDSTEQAKLFGLLTDLLTVLRRITVEIVEAVERWRLAGHAKQPFIWGSSNYLLKAASDTSFLELLPGFERHIGVTISNNPFFFHEDLDGRSTRLSRKRREDLNKSTEFPFSGPKSASVSAKRVKAAATVLRREIMREERVQTANCFNNPTRLKQSRSRRQARNECHMSCGGLGHESLRTSNESGGNPPADNPREHGDNVVYTECHVSGWESNMGGEAGGEVPSRNGPKAFREGRDLPQRSTVESATLSADNEMVDSRFQRYPEEEHRKLDGTGEYYPYQEYTDYHGYPYYENYGGGGQWSQWGQQEYVGYSSEPHEAAADNLATQSANEERPRYDYTQVHHHEQNGHADEQPTSPYSNAYSGYPRRGQWVEQTEAGDEQTPGDDQGTPQQKTYSGGLDVAQSSEAEVSHDPQHGRTYDGGAGDSRESPFMVIFDMCDRMLSDIQGLGIERKVIEAPREDALGVDDAYSFSAMPAERNDLAQENAVWKPPCRKWNTADKARVSGIPEINEDEPLPRGAAYDHQTETLNAGLRWDQNQDEGEGSDWLRRKAPQDTLADMSTALDRKTEARLNHRIEKAERHYRHGKLRRSMALWEARRAQALQTRTAEAFAGQLGISRHFVRYVFNALRAHARGSRIAARNRWAMETVAAHLKNAGKMRLMLAFKQWARSLTKPGQSDEDALTKLGEFGKKTRMDEAFEKLRPSSEGLQTKKAERADAFMAAVSTTSKSAEARTRRVKYKQGFHSGTTGLREDSWERWLGDEESAIGSTLCDLGAERQEDRSDDGHSGGSTVSTIQNQNVAERPPKSPQGRLDGIKAKIKSFGSFGDMRGSIQARHQRPRSTLSFTDACLSFSPRYMQLGKRISLNNASHRQLTGVLQPEAAARRVQHAWRVSRERKVVARVTNSASLIRKIWQAHSRRRHAGVRVVRAWRRRTCLRAHTLDRALIEAASAGDLRAVTFLLRPGVGWKTGADVNGTADYGLTALHAACMYASERAMTFQGNSAVGPDVCRVLVDGDRGLSSERGKWGLTDRPDWIGVIRALVEAGAPVEANDWKGFTPIMSATAEGDAETVAALAAFGAEVDAVEGGVSKRTPLIIAAQTSNAPTATTLLEYGARVNIAAADGMTPLHEAICAGSIAVAEILVRVGANVNTTSSSKGITPLHLAITNDQHAASRLLVRSGANICQPDARGITPLRLAVEKGDASIAALLLSAEPHVDLSVYDENGGTILHEACRLGMTDVARLLLKAGADPYVLDAQGKTPELVALAMGHTECACLFYQTEIRSFRPQERNESVTTVHRHEAEVGMLRRELNKDGTSIDEGRFMNYTTPPNAEIGGGEEYAFYEEAKAQYSDGRSSDDRGDRQGEEKGILDADPELGSVHERYSGILTTAHDAIGVHTEGYQVPDSPAEIGYGQHERQESGVPVEEGLRYEEENLVALSSAENLATEGRTHEEGHEAGVNDWGEWEWSDTEGWRARQYVDDPLPNEHVLVKGEEPSSLQVDVTGEEGEYKQHETDLCAEWDAKHSSTTDMFRDSFNGTLQASQTQQAAKPDGQAIEGEEEVVCDDNKHVERHVHFYPGEEDHKGGGDGPPSGEDVVVPDHEGYNRALDQPWEEQPEPALHGREFDDQHYAVIEEGDEGSRNEPRGERGSLSSNAGPQLVQDSSSVQPEVARNDNSFDGEGEKISEGGATLSMKGSNAWSMASRTLPTANTWISLVDGESGYTYYQNQESGETQWEPPPDDDILIAPEYAYGDATVAHS